jgi:hypothetical protein
VQTSLVMCSRHRARRHIDRRAYRLGRHRRWRIRRGGRRCHRRTEPRTAGRQRHRLRAAPRRTTLGLDTPRRGTRFTRAECFGAWWQYLCFRPTSATLSCTVTPSELGGWHSPMHRQVADARGSSFDRCLRRVDKSVDLPLSLRS